MSKRIRPKRVKTTILKSKKGGIKMNVIELAESNVQLTCLTEISVIIQRSEEHTSELQSRVDLVCRLLLEIGRASCRERV